MEPLTIVAHVCVYMLHMIIFVHVGDDVFKLFSDNIQSMERKQNGDQMLGKWLGSEFKLFSGYLHCSGKRNGGQILGKWLGGDSSFFLTTTLVVETKTKGVIK